MNAESGDGSAEEELIVRLALRPGDPLSGLLAVEGVSGETDFSGWVELMAAINAARGHVASDPRGAVRFKESPATGDADDPRSGDDLAYGR